MSKLNKPLTSLAILLLAGIAGGCATQAGRPETNTENWARNDFPTQARVEYVFQCMQKKGAQNYDTMYSCVCSADKLAEKMNYASYSEAMTFANLGGLTGDRGNVVRDAPQGRQLKKELQDAMKYAQDACTVSSPVGSK